MVFRDTFRLIKSTFNRFAAIFAIVFIGVAFMMGLLSNYDIMQESVEDYYDNNNLFDFQLYSNFGFDDVDLKTIKDLDVVKSVVATKTRDVFVVDEDDFVNVARVLEMNLNMNKIELLSGRYPKANNECLVFSGYSEGKFGINDHLRIYLEDEDLSTSFKNTDFIVVGTATSPEFMSEMQSTSLLRNLDLNIIMYIPSDNFISDYYSSCYITLNNAKELNSFKQEYADYIEQVLPKIEKLSESQSSSLKDRIVADAEAKLNEAKEMLAKETADAQKKLDDGKAKLDKANRDIKSGEKEIADNEKLIAEKQAEIDEGYIQLTSAENALNTAIAEIESRGLTIDQIVQMVNIGYGTFSEYKNVRDSYRNNIAELELERQQYTLVIQSSGYSSIEQVEEAMRLISDHTSPQYLYLVEVHNAFSGLNRVNQEIASYQSLDTSFSIVIDLVEFVAERVTGGNVDAAFTYVTGLYDQYLNARAQIESGKAALAEGQIQLNEGRKQLEEAKIKLEKGKKEYNEGLKEYEEGQAELIKQTREAQDQIDDAEAQLASLSEPEWHILDRNMNYSNVMYRNTCDQMYSIGLIMPILFFVVAALVCSTTMTRLIDEQRGQIGIYRALGFRKGEIVARYLLYVLLASLFASIFAIAAGLFIFPTVIYNTWRLMYVLPDIKIFAPIIKLIICVSSFSILMMIISYIVINGSLKECSAQLLRPKAPKNAKAILLEKIKFIWNRLSFTSKITVRNLVRYKGRFFMTVIGVAGCTSLLVLGFGVRDSIRDVVELQFNHIVKYDYSVDIKNDRHIDDILSYLSSDANNTTVAEYAVYSSNVISGDNEDALNVICSSSDNIAKIFNLFDYKTHERIRLDDNSVIVSQKFAKLNEIKVGDTITIESYSGEKAKVKVSHISELYVDHYLYITDTLYDSLFTDKAPINKVAINNVGNTDKLFAITNEFGDVNSVYDLTNSISSFNQMVVSLDLIIIVIILASGALAFVVLINLTNVNISERIREIATLKVLGFRDSEVDGYIFKEVLLLSIIGALIGLPLGNVELKFVMTMIDMEMCTFPTIIKNISYVYGFGITMVFTIIVFFLTKNTLRKVQMVESLKSIE